MPKKKKCGKNTKSNTNGHVEKRKLIEADLDGQIYGIVEKALGDRYFEVDCTDNKKRRCRVRSKRLKIQVQECVIVALRDFDDNNGDIIYRYNPDEVRSLQKEGILPGPEILGGIKEDGLEDVGDGFSFEDI
jgi:initiation factor 1A